MVLSYRFYSLKSRNGHILRSIEALLDLLATLVYIYILTLHSCLTLSLSLERHLNFSAFTFIHLRFNAAVFPPHLMGHICCLLFHIRHLTTGDLSHLCNIFFHICHLLSHIFRGESCTSATFSISSASISDVCWRLSRLVSSTFSAFVYTLN